MVSVSKITRVPGRAQVGSHPAQGLLRVRHHCSRAGAARRGRDPGRSAYRVGALSERIRSEDAVTLWRCTASRRPLHPSLHPRLVKLKTLLGATLAIAFACCVRTYAAPAPAFPTKPIRFVVPFAPGGSTDTLARTLGQKI